MKFPNKNIENANGLNPNKISTIIKSNIIKMVPFSAKCTGILWNRKKNKNKIRDWEKTEELYKNRKSTGTEHKVWKRSRGAHNKEKQTLKLVLMPMMSMYYCLFPSMFSSNERGILVWIKRHDFCAASLHCYFCP